MTTLLKRFLSELVVFVKTVITGMSMEKRVIVLVGFLLLLCMLLASGLAYYYYQQYRSVKNKSQTATNIESMRKALEEETKKIVGEVGKLIELPSDEIPTVATVTNIEKLKAQPFFTHGKNGDKVLIFSNARKVILYDPTAKRIIEVSAISLGAVPDQTVTQQTKIALFNGTNTPGMTTQIETVIKKTFPEANVTIKEAAKGNYSTTGVIVLTPSAVNIANILAKSLNVQVIPLPTEETKPAGDVLVLIGEDKTASASSIITSGQ